MACHILTIFHMCSSVHTPTFDCINEFPNALSVSFFCMKGFFCEHLLLNKWYVLTARVIQNTRASRPFSHYHTCEGGLLSL